MFDISFQSKKEMIRKHTETKNSLQSMLIKASSKFQHRHEYDLLGSNLTGDF